MRISNVEVITVAEELPKPLRWGRFTYRHKGAVLVRVSTDDGVFGIGEAGMSIRYWRTVSAFVDEVLKPALLGTDPLMVRRRWLDMDGISHKCPARGIDSCAVAGVEMALWDILGKVCNQSVCTLLGSVHTDIPAYWAPARQPIADLLSAAETALHDGFRGVKLRLTGNLTNDVRMVSEMRNLGKDEIDIMVDANMSYSYHDALLLAKHCADLGVFWIEEPFEVTSLQQYTRSYAEFRTQVGVRVAGGEGFSSHFDFVPVLEVSALDILQPDCVSVGGIHNAKRVADMAEAANVLFAPHVSCASVAEVSMMANLHVAGSCDKTVYFEHDATLTSSRMRQEIFGDSTIISDGVARLPNAPGLGIHVDDAVLSKYLVDG